MSYTPYELALTLQGHSSDVRNILAPQAGVPLLLSGSRDGSAILWGPSSRDPLEWDMKLQVQGPEGRYISCVGMVRAHGEAYLLLGSSNGVLSSFVLPSATAPPSSTGSPDANHTLIEHKQNLCCLDTSKGGLIASGSWDKSVVIWKDFKPAVTIEAHTQSVWAVKFVGEDRLLTGELSTHTAADPGPTADSSASADGSIKLHTFDVFAGKTTVLQEYSGHKQPVRGLSLRVDGKGFWSCANDSLVNLYAFDRLAPVTSLSGHTSFVYSVTALPDGSGAISSGEDGTLRVWSSSELLQTITHPATSLWSCTAVPTISGTDVYIATGANDGIIRFFTKEKELMAPEVVREKWTQEVSQRQLDKSQVGDVKHSDLPGMEALGREGKKDGQVIMIKNNDKVEAYQWSAPTTTWQQIGQVVDAVGSGRRQLHEGQEYDFVFDVDVSEGMPPLKLPYNASENPWAAAKKFLTKHDLPESYAEQVVEFIQKSAGGVELGTGADQEAYVDPFTGGSRYTGSSSSRTGGGGGGGGGSDPYTGGSSYSSTPSSAPKPKGVLPVTAIQTFKTMNFSAAKSKIASLNADLKLLSAEDGAVLERVYAFLGTPAGSLPSAEGSDGEVAEGLMRIVQSWPEAQRFPLIDLARCLAALSSAFAQTPSLPTLFLTSAFWGQPTPSSSADIKARETNTLLALRGISNLFGTKLGQQAVLRSAGELLAGLNGGHWVSGAGGGKWKVAAATVALNYSVLGVEGELPAEHGQALLDLILSILQNEQTDNETIYRASIALGNVLVSPSLPGSLQVGKVQVGKELVRDRAGKLGEKRLVDLYREISGLGV